MVLVIRKTWIAMRCLVRAALVALVLTAAPSCMPMIPYTSGTALPKARVEAIRAGITTKYGLLQSFGMPMAIAKQGETVAIPRGRQHAVGRSPAAPPTPHEFESASGDMFFEPFSHRFPGPQHRVYYYAHTTSSAQMLVVIMYVREWAEARSDQLWVLINEEKGLVEDFLYRPARP